MSAIEAMLRQPGAQAVGWALLHFVWQGGLVAVSTAAALALLRRSAADVRYVVSAIALSVMLTLPAVTESPERVVSPPSWKKLMASEGEPARPGCSVATKAFLPGP